MKLFLFLLLFFSFAHASFSAKIVDANTSLPIEGALVSDAYKSVKSDINGSFTIHSDEELYHIKAIGYRPFAFHKDFNTSIIKLSPIKVRALYLTFWGASNHSSRLKKLLKVIEETKANAVVVDVKNEYGSTLYWTSVDEANSYGAYKHRTNRNIKKFMDLMKSKNIYTIARIVTFKDELQASHNPDYAIKDEKGNIWRNYDKMAWVDPFDERSHDYTLNIAEDAAKVGFDEINFDYIRFPARKGLQFSKQNNQANRVKAIAKFLESAKERLKKYGVFTSVDTYGNVCWSKNDNNIGQTIASLKDHVDYLSPMLYPSGFSTGSFNFVYPSEHPYEVIYRSIKHIENQIDTKRIRPWLQYFKDYAHKKRYYKKFEVNEQIRATKELGTNGWMMWSPSSRYNPSYFK